MIARLARVLLRWGQARVCKERMETLVATRPFSYAGKLVVRGQVFTAPDKHARLLKLAKRAKAVDFVPPAPDASQDAASPSEPRSKRQYKRRDLEAEK